MDMDPKFKDGVCISQTIDACVTLSKREMKQEILTRPFPPCESEHRLMGLPGDGRSRDITLAEGEAILRAELHAPFTNAATGIHY